MKRKLHCLILCLGTIGFVEAQILEVENFENLTLGNISTSTNGTTVGQGGFYALNGAPNNYQIINDASPHGKVLQITGQSDGSQQDFTLFKNNLPTLWASRSALNSIIEIEFDLFTGPATTSLNVQILFLYDQSQTKVLTGFGYLPETRELLGVTYYNNNGTVNNYAFKLSQGGLFLPVNSWVRIGMSYNKTTGSVLWKAPGMPSAIGIISAAVNLDPHVLKFIVEADPNNTLAFNTKWDNVSIKATNTNTLSSTNPIADLDKKIEIYPNPTSGFVTLKTDFNSEITKITISDSSGRIHSVFTNYIEQIDFSKFNAGIYLLTIETNNGNATRKIVKF